VSRRRAQRGAAVVDVVLVMAVLLPVVLGIVQLSLVLFVRTTLTAAASEGARLAATADRGPEDGAALAREQIAEAVSGRYAQDVTARPAYVGGAPGVEVVVRARVPALGLGGPGIDLTVTGHAVEEAP
jgi:Flp pilus assembly protein TadG